MNGALVEEETFAEPTDNGPSAQDGDGNADTASALSSQVTSAFGELARVQAELRDRLQEFGDHEAELAALKDALETERDEIDAKSARIARLHRDTESREAAFEKREEALSKREEAVCSFQAMLARMTSALEDLTPANMKAATEAADAAFRDAQDAAEASALACANTAPAPNEEPTAVSPKPTAATPRELDESIDLSDLTPEEHHRVKMLLQLGTATTGEIAEQIRVERDASSKSSKRRSKKKGKTRSWLF